MKEKESKPDSQKPNQELDTPGKLMVSGIPRRENYTNADLEKQFTPFGRITEVNIVRDKRTSIPRGFAFVTYENPKDSLDAIKAMEGKDLGGEKLLHCEQAVIGYNKSKSLNDNSQGGRGGLKTRGGGRGGGGGRGQGRGGGAGRGQGRGGGGERGHSRAGAERRRGLLGPGGRGGPGLLGRGGLFQAKAFDLFPEDESYEDFYEPEPLPRGLPSRGGRGLLAFRGAATRGGLVGLSPLARGGLLKKALLPSPSLLGDRGGFYPGPAGDQGDDYYDEDEGNAYQAGDSYYGDSYAEGYDDPYAEEQEYSNEGLYGREFSAQLRGRGILARGMGILARGRGVASKGLLEARAPLKRQLDEYGYAAETELLPRPRVAAAGPSPLLRRNVPVYSDEGYEEDNPRMAAADLFSRGRGKITAGRLIKGALIGRGGAAPQRRAALLETNPYAQEDLALYERLPAKAVPRVAGGLASEYDDDPYKRRISVGAPRQLAERRPRGLLEMDDEYAPDRRQAKPSLLGDARRAALGAASRFADDYQSLEPQAFGDGRRIPARRGDHEFRLREDPYRVAAETDSYGSYPSSRSAGEPLASDPYSRKRAVDLYDDSADDGLLPLPVIRMDYDNFRRSAPVPTKKERIDRGGDRNMYGGYSGM